MTGLADRWIRRTTIGCVGLLALIAGTVSYLHMNLLVELHGQPGWVAALTAPAHRSDDGSLPSGSDIGREHGHHERWGRLVKRSGLAGDLEPQP